MQMRRNFLMLQRKYDFDQAGHSRGRFQMPHICFYRSHDKRMIRITIFSKHSVQRADFYGIAERGSGPVCLNIADLPWVNPAVSQCITDHFFLGRAIGNSQPAAGPVLIHGCPTNDSEDIVSVSHSV